jgi:trans-aconitate methyltransferase
MDTSKNTIRLYNKYATQYQDKFMDMDLYLDTYDLFCDLIEKKDADVFEIACGPGNITKYLISKRSDFKIQAIDLAPNMIDLAKSNIPSARFEIMDCREISKINKKYDAIMCGFCLPYLSKVEAIQLIDDASKLLKLDGIFYMSTMEDNYNKSGYQGASFGGEDRMFIHYHQSNYLLKALEQSHFKIIKKFYKNYPEKDGSITKDLILIAKKSK